MSWFWAGVILFENLALLLALGRLVALLRELRWMRRQIKVNRHAGAQVMAQGRRMKEQAEENHRYALHLLRVARDHETQAKKLVEKARKERGRSEK